MLSRVCAAWLVALIVLPFSAPFSTCDLETLFPAANRHAPAHPGSPSPATLLAHATSHAIPMARSAGRVKFVGMEFRSPTLSPATARLVSSRTLTATFASSPSVVPLRI